MAGQLGGVSCGWHGPEHVGPLGSNFDMAPVCSLSSWASRVGRRGRLVQTVLGFLDTVHPSPMLALFGRAATGKIKVQRNQALFVGWLTFWSLPEFYIGGK